MISKEDFNKINKEVKDGVCQVFEFIKKQSRFDQYIIFLASGDFDDVSCPIGSGFNPNTIDNKTDHYKDETRIKFFSQFLNSFYSFPEGVTEVPDDEMRISLELMVYTHIWESKSLLKQLFRMSQLSLGNLYPWKAIVPEMSKHEFIRKNIRGSFESLGLDIAEIIKKGFHTSLRNAFAHSEFSLNDSSKRIILHTYKGDSRWDIPDITYDDWTKRFVYSSLLSFYVIQIKNEIRTRIPSDFKELEFSISHPVGSTSIKYRRIKYYKDHDIFRFVQS